MEKYQLSDVEFEEIEGASIELDGTTYQMAKVTAYPLDVSKQEFEEGRHHCDICALAEDCCYYTPNLSVCEVFRDLLRLNYQDIGKLFFN